MTGVVLEGLRVDAIFTCFSLFAAHEGSRHGKFAWQLGSCMVKGFFWLKDVESMTGQDCTRLYDYGPKLVTDFDTGMLTYALYFLWGMRGMGL